MITILMGELERAYRVLDAVHADMQNWRDITGWREQGLITETECKALRDYNKKLYRESGKA